ncbi:hypothetical protein PHYBLDRAFT_65188 [Phycomyces blakesleeanus NRRL 1555(-)]|uniref:G-protein coupled receptors family 2 profile 2 domain-containing protein n=1 Tax=Phycomyces blakesleeanus (strain ATCC 8743b / DSM 1359 / FGSC 10004 / NBRC 33097 / NRRL 1555) TaxID=763407 RepID=A0A167MHU2_PHYB8|nr:hypothetical protein PHYBLDRAFT_65188 [Phycomyces blakesleeanus NRRL 1555(-)]OAD72886.1 hypothetical protein PHYBLDRAFT_65188 [Phycomyces blakesleeanus NRRL 1555(-)]|eukprot:XP_018290926.1 hypothetical protein PHYBLDRAFT_65188 [Phycomyces blakesleeanus NRRL 1555(-)]
MASFLWHFNQTELDAGVVPDDLLTFSKKISGGLFIISFIGTAIVCLGYGFIRWIAPSYDRASLRLLVYGAISHMFLGAASMCRNKPFLPVKTCGFCMFLFIFCNVFSAACFTCMAINLHLVYVHSARNIKHLGWYYVIGSFSIAFILAILPLFPKNTHYGHNNHMGICWYNASTHRGSLLWAITTIYLWVAIFILYCCISICIILIKMRREEVAINANLAVDSNQNNRNYCFSHLFFRPRHRLGTMPEEQPSMPSSLLQSQLSTRNDRKLESSYVLKTVSRVIWYPIVLIITRIWSVINVCIMAATSKVNPFFSLMSYIALPIQDPAFIAAIRQFIYRIRPSKKEQKAPALELSLSRHTGDLSNGTGTHSWTSRQRSAWSPFSMSIQIPTKIHPSQHQSSSSSSEQNLIHESEIDLSSCHRSSSA